MHRLDVRADGSIWHGSTRVLAADAQDLASLQAHLAAVALAMPQEPTYFNHLEGPKSPDGLLQLHLDGAAPFSSLAGIAEVCLEQGIWDCSLVQEHWGSRPTTHRYLLPKVVFPGSNCYTDIADTSLEIHVRCSKASARPEAPHRVHDYEVACPVGGSASKVIYEKTVASDLPGLRSALRPHLQRWSGRHVWLEPDPSLPCAEVLTTARSVLDVGFASVHFAGGCIER